MAKKVFSAISLYMKVDHFLTFARKPDNLAFRGIINMFVQKKIFIDNICKILFTLRIYMIFMMPEPLGPLGIIPVK